MDMNQMLAYVANLKKQGYTPQAAMNLLMQQHPELQSAMMQMQNMSQGKNPQEFVSQLCKQNGIDYDNIMKMF